MKKFYLLGLLPLLLIQFLMGQVSFNTGKLSGSSLYRPTSLQFGPDGKLYVSTQDGMIYRYTVQKTPTGYQVLQTEAIALVKQIPNHNDDGLLNAAVTYRQITGILVTGTASSPKLYVTSSDPRIGGAGNEGSSPNGDGDVNLDTNSGFLSLLTWNGSSWSKTDLVRGLPRSEENHAQNGMALDIASQSLYITSGGMTNAGSPSVNFAMTTEYALAACVLKVDLNALMAMPVKGTGNNSYVYDLPTLDDPTRANSGGQDLNDPFGGNDGLNQAKIVPGGPVQVFSPGYRNMYDIVLTQTAGKAGRLYGIDNGANPGWGGYPDKEGTAQVTNKYVSGEPGSLVAGVNDAAVNNLDNLHLIYSPGTAPIYGGHPVPVRANPGGAGLFWKNGSGNNYSLTPTADWPPVPLSMANPVEADFRNPGVNDGAITTFYASTNGITEYTASTFFNGQLTGDLLTVSFDGNLYRLKLSADGKSLVSNTSIASGFANIPLDVTAQGDADIFPGTIWVADYMGNSIHFFEPATGSGSGSPNDLDGDGFTNQDEVDNGTDPNSAASKPKDADGDKISDLNDPDDDNDGIPDTSDVFYRDALNGTNVLPPLLYPFLNGVPGTGLFGMGFTGLMSNGTDPGKLFNESANGFIMGGAVGLASVPASNGSPLTNNQQQAFQVGFLPQPAHGVTTVESGLIYPFFNGVPAAQLKDELHGLYVGTGDQDNYVLVAITPNFGNPGILVLQENNGSPLSAFYPVSSILSENLSLFLDINPTTGTIQPKYKKVSDAQAVNIGLPITVSGKLLNTLKGAGATAAGILASARTGNGFSASWDFLKFMTSATLPPTPTTWRINTGGGAVQTGGFSWNADGQFTNTDPAAPSQTYSSSTAISNTTAPVLYQSERYGKSFSYKLPLPNGTYTVNLHFAEIYWTTTGKRIFNVNMENGQGTLSNYDILTETAPKSALIKSFTINITDGELSILFTAVTDMAKISAIEVMPFYAPTPPPPPLPAAPTIRINTGGPAQTLNGQVWESDKSFGGGSSYTYSSSAPVSNTSISSVYQTERYGNSFAYTIPVTTGQYQVTLHFAEIYWTSSGSRLFNVNVENGQGVLSNFDIFAVAGKNSAVSRSFTVNVTDGQLNIDLTTVKDNAKISGIEITPLVQTAAGPRTEVVPEILLTPLEARLTPNPFNNRFVLSMHGGNGEAVDIHVMNASGQVLETIRKADPALPLYLGERYPSGLYFVEVRQARERLIRSIIKQ